MREPRTMAKVWVAEGGYFGDEPKTVASTAWSFEGTVRKQFENGCEATFEFDTVDGRGNER